MPNTTPVQMSALFTEDKLQDYKNVITFENYQSNLDLLDVIKLHGVDPIYLNKSMLKVHPHDLLVQQPDLGKVEDQNYVNLFKTHPRLFKVDMDVLLQDLVFPLTSAFNHRFGTLPYDWLNSYLMATPDRDIYDQDRITIESFCQILKLNDEESRNVSRELISKYIFAVQKIEPSWITDIQYIDNPYYSVMQLDESK